MAAGCGIGFWKIGVDFVVGGSCAVDMKVIVINSKIMSKIIVNSFLCDTISLCGDIQGAILNVSGITSSTEICSEINNSMLSNSFLIK